MANLKGNNTQYGNTSGPGSSSSCSVSSLETIKNVAKELALDVIVDFARPESSSSPRNKHVQTLKRTMREISQRHEILFCSIIRRLEIVDRSEVCSRFTRVVNELLVDGQLNWGRIVTIYAFAGWLARHCSENGMPDSVQEISECAGTYVADKLSDWISQQGGWVSNFV